MKLPQVLFIILLAGALPILTYATITTEKTLADDVVLINNEEVKITCASDDIPSIQKRIADKEKKLASIVLNETGEDDSQLHREIDDLYLQLNRLTKNVPDGIYAISNDLLQKLHDDKSNISDKLEKEKNTLIESEVEQYNGLHILDNLTQEKAGIEARRERLNDLFHEDFDNKTKIINEKGLQIIDEIESTEEEMKLAEDADPDHFSAITLFLLRMRLTLLNNKLKSLKKDFDLLKNQKEEIRKTQLDNYKKAFDEILNASIENQDSIDREKGRIIDQYQTAAILQLRADYLSNQLNLDKARLYCMTQLEKNKKDLPERTTYPAESPKTAPSPNPWQIIIPKNTIPARKKILPFGRPPSTSCQNGTCPAAYPCLPV